MPATSKTADRAPSERQLRLDRKLDQNAALALTQSFRDMRGHDLRLDAGMTEHFGTLAVQSILAAARTWAKDDLRLRIGNVSDACVDQLRLLGFTPESLAQGDET